MRSYASFSQVTSEAFNYALAALGLSATEAQKNDLLMLYRRLPAFGEAKAALHVLAQQCHAMHAFSNGTTSDIAALMQNSGLSAHLSFPVSVETVESFKPDPRAYTLFETKTGSSAANTWLISSNSFDVVGAGACGWRTIWVHRDPAITFDPWGSQPTHIVQDLSQISEILEPVSWLCCAKAGGGFILRIQRGRWLA